MSSHDWHDELVLIADLTRLNKQIASYVLRALDADASRIPPTNAVEEHALGVRLVDLGTALKTRAAARPSRSTRLVIEGTLDTNPSPPQPGPAPQP